MRLQGTLLSVLAVVLGATAAHGADELLSGRKLLLTPKRLHVVSKDPGVGVGTTPESADDPVLHGGWLRVLSIEGDVFDTTYPLPAGGWRYLRRRGVVIGYTFRGSGPIRRVRIRHSKALRVRGRGDLGHTLGASPAPVRIVLGAGERQYCLSFGGKVRANARRFRASHADPPALCPLPYTTSDAAWVCHPAMAEDPCRTSDLDATVIEPDLGTRFEPHEPAEQPAFDCFHVYPTVWPQAPSAPAIGNQPDISDPFYVSSTRGGVLAQAARFGKVCRVFAPHYRQATLIAQVDENRETYWATAYRDVLDAWRLYLRYENAGRNVVIMGHSQGAEMATRLLQGEFDGSETLRSSLVVALLLGGGVAAVQSGGVRVPQGEVVGESFQNLPLCQSAEESGCVVAFRSYAAGYPPVSGSNDIGGPDVDVACTNPAALGQHGVFAPFRESYLPADPILFPGIPTPYVKLEHLWSGRCVKDTTDHSYLEVAATPGPDDLREDPFDYGDPALSPALLGTHVIDFSWALGDLIELVRSKAEAMP